MHLLPLHDGRPGLRTLLPVEAREPVGLELEIANGKSQIRSPDTLDFISSTATLDRYHEIIDPAGWRLESYRRNPVFQNAHQYGDILFTLGKALITEVRNGECGTTDRGMRSGEWGMPSEGGGSEFGVGSAECGMKAPTSGACGSGSTPHSAFRTPRSDVPHSALPIPHLYQRVQFATDVNPMARIAYGLYKGSFLNAVSVGFIPIRWEDAPASGHGANSKSEIPDSASLRIPRSEIRTPVRRRYLEQELLEVSAVAIPANPDALALGLKSGAIIKDDLAQTLELLRCLTMPWSTSAPRATHLSGARGLSPLIAFARELQRILRYA